MKHSWILLCFFVFTKWLYAQPIQKEQAVPGAFSVRFNPMGLVDVFDGNLSIGGEYAINSRLSLTADISFIFYSVYFEQSKLALGYNIKPGIRYYTSERRKAFLEAIFFYKRVGYKIEDWLGKDCVNGIPAYDAYEEFTFRKRVLGFNIQGGLQRSLTRDNLLRMEFYAGIGVRFKWQDIKNDPMACYQLSQFFFDDIIGPYYFGASIPHGLRLVYSIK